MFAGDLGADTAFKGLAFWAGSNALSVPEGISRFAGEDDAFSEVDVVLLVDWAVDGDTTSVLKLESSSAFDSDTFAVSFNIADSTG